MRNTTFKILGALIALILVFTVAMPIVNAVDLTQTTGSLTIVKYEVNSEKESEYDDENGILLEGVTFAIYQIDDDSESTEIPTGATAYATDITDENGTVTFSSLPLGRYLVVEVSAPENVVSKIANFIVDIPMTNDNGDGFVYDVTVYPKNNTVYGGVTLTKYGNDETEKLTGVGFELQKEGDDGSWTKYNTEDLATDTNGQIIVTGLPAGNYRFVETSTLTGYILDNNTTYEFTVSLDEDDGSTIVTPSTIDVYNQKPTITKEVVDPTDDYSYTTGDTITYAITVDIPWTIENIDTFEITDVLPDGVEYVEDSITVYGRYRNTGSWDNEAFWGSSVDIQSGTMYITPGQAVERSSSGQYSYLSSYSTLYITYQVTLTDDADATSIGNTNTATLTYSTIVSTDYNGNENEETTATVSDSATVYTGGFFIEKRAKTSDGDLLQGAVFKLASSEANAKAGTYLKDESGNDITLTTGSNGLASYHGLAYGTYYLVEVQAPSYDDNGTTKYYNLLTSPVEITVGADTYSSDEATTIINKTGFTLPVTGGIGATIIIIAGIALVGTGVTLYQKGENK